MRAFASEPTSQGILTRNHSVASPELLPRLETVSPISPDEGLIQRKSHCACGGGCPRCAGESHYSNIQTKLTVSTPGDQYEQEADQVADQVMRTPEARVQRACAPCATGTSPCTQCEPEGDKPIQRKAEPASAQTASSADDAFRSDLGHGQPLDAATRASMESRFGYDFSHVRVHTDERAKRSARSVDSLAFTVGRNVVFGAGLYAPTTSEGQRLLAHELTHVVQQTGGASTYQLPVTGDKQFQNERQGSTVPPVVNITPSNGTSQVFRQPATDVSAETVNDQWACVIRNLCDAPIDAGERPIKKVNDQCRSETDYPEDAPDVEPTQSQCQLPEVSLQEALDEIDKLDREIESVETSGGRGDWQEYAAGLRAHRNEIRDKAWSLCVMMKTPDECRRLHPAFEFKGATLVANALVAEELAAAVVLGVGALLIIRQQLLSEQMRNPQAREAVRELGETMTWPTPAPIPLSDETEEQREARLKRTPTADPTTSTESQPTPERRTDPFVPTAPEEDEPYRRRCSVEEVDPMFGRYPCHSDFAKTFSGSRREFLVTTPEGFGIRFDAKRGETLYEVKTGYGWMLNPKLTPEMKERRERVLEDFHDQAFKQFLVSLRCGYDLVWYFNSKKVAEYFNSLLEPDVKGKKFDCKKDSDHTW
jgi:hypothetical protein